MTSEHAPVLVTAGRDRMADVIERQGALLSTGSDQQDHFRAVEIADALLASGAVVAVPPETLVRAIYRPPPRSWRGE